MADRNKIEYNWYEILELEYYPAAEENEEKIKARIEEKRKEWLRKETDPLNGTKYKNYGELLKHGVIESEMLNSAKRKELIKDAQNKLFEPIDKFLRFFEGSIITSEKIQEIAARIKRKEDLIKKRIEENGKIELYDEKIYKNYCECINRKYEFLTVEQNLKILDKKNLYEFLDSENINAGRLDARGIIEAIKEKRKKLIKSDNETSAKKKLFTECEKIFGNGAKRNEYDEYLKYLKYIEVKKELEEIKSIYEITDKQISTEKSDNFNNIKNILSSEKEAKNVFIGFCEANKISYNITNSSSGSQKAHAADPNHETINGYTYLKDNGKESTFSRRSLGYEQTLIGVEDQYQPYMDIKSEYCNAVNEIEKVDKGIVPGTDIPFRQATYTEVDDAYREYLQKIAQIRQVVILAIANEDMENEAGCYYKGTHWNNANSQYKAKQFYNDEIDNYYNNHRNQY